jgi:hypothetical protein
MMWNCQILVWTTHASLPSGLLFFAHVMLFDVGSNIPRLYSI